MKVSILSIRVLFIALCILCAVNKVSFAQQRTLSFTTNSITPAASMVLPNKLALQNLPCGIYTSGQCDQATYKKFNLVYKLKVQDPDPTAAIYTVGRNAFNVTCTLNTKFVNCTTPANFFHVLRRQIHSSWRKPLIIMTPKSLLRHKRSISNLNEFVENTRFFPVLHDPIIKKASRIILCSGKVYYDLLEVRDKNQIDDIPIIRIEEFYPFPNEALQNALKPYGDVPVIWCQEETKNGGAWQFLDRRIENVLKNLCHKNNRPFYVGRPEGASPATGIAGRHDKEQAAIIQAALLELLPLE